MAPHPPAVLQYLHRHAVILCLSSYFHAYLKLGGQKTKHGLGVLEKIEHFKNSSSNFCLSLQHCLLLDTSRVETIFCLTRVFVKLEFSIEKLEFLKNSSF